MNSKNSYIKLNIRNGFVIVCGRNQSLKYLKFVIKDISQLFLRIFSLKNLFATIDLINILLEIVLLSSYNVRQLSGPIRAKS